MFTPSSLWENNRRASQGETFISSSAGLTSQSAGVWPRVTGPIFFLLFLIFLYFFFFFFGSVNSSLSECHGRPAPQLLEAAVYARESHPLSFFLFRTIRQKDELFRLFFFPSRLLDVYSRYGLPCEWSSFLDKREKDAMKRRFDVRTWADLLISSDPATRVFFVFFSFSEKKNKSKRDNG